MIEAQTKDGKVMIPATPEMVAEETLRLYLLKAAQVLLTSDVAKGSNVVAAKALADAQIAEIEARVSTKAVGK
jgi:hypothetical protein